MKIANKILVTSLLLGAAIGTAQATEVCFKLDSFGDVFRLSSISSEDNTLYFGKDLAITVSSIPIVRYAIPLVGSAAPPPGPGTAASLIGLHGVNHTTFFGNHSDCIFDIVLGGAGSPVLSVSCEGRVPGVFAKTNVMAHYISCGQANQVAQAAARAAPGAAKALGQ